MLVGGRRASRLARQLVGLGVEVRAMSAKTGGQLPPGALVIGAGGQLRVRAERVPDQVDWAASVVPGPEVLQDAGIS